MYVHRPSVALRCSVFSIGPDLFFFLFFFAQAPNIGGVAIDIGLHTGWLVGWSVSQSVSQSSRQSVCQAVSQMFSWLLCLP